MKHEYTDLCQVLDMLNSGKVVKYLPRLNVTQNSVSAPWKMLYSAGGGHRCGFHSLQPSSPSSQEMKKRFRKQPKYYLQEAEALGSKPYIYGPNCYIIQGRAEQTRWQGEVGSSQVSTGLSSPVPHSHSPALAPRAAGESPKGSTSLLHHLLFADKKGTWETFCFMLSNLWSPQLYLRMSL